MELGTLLAYWTHDLSPFLWKWNENFGIRYYGLAYVIGFIWLYFGLRYQVRQGWCRLSEESYDRFLTWMIVGVMVGGRVGYCLLYTPQATWENPLIILQPWRGGMASHGGFIGVIAVLYYYSRHYKIPFYNLADATTFCAPFALGLGRIANFINGELWGRPATVPWAVIFPRAGGEVPRHPSQLYEALLEGLLLGIVLFIVRKRVRQDGIVSLTFLGGYCVLRFIVEFFRAPDPQIGFYFGYFTQGQLLSVVFLLLTGVLAWFQFGRARTRMQSGR